MRNGSSFELSNRVDKEKVFLVNLSDIEGRIDPSAYQSAFYFISNVYPSFRLSKLTYINPITSFPTQENAEYSFIPMDAVSANDGNIKYTLNKHIDDIKGFKTNIKIKCFLKV